MEEVKDLVVGIDLGGTRIKIGLIVGDTVVDTMKINSHSEEPLENRLPELEKTINSILEKHGYSKNDLKGIGMAFPGVVDFGAKRVSSRFVKYPDSWKLDLGSWCKDRFGTAFALENDARAALVGEWQYGAGKGAKNLVLLTLGTGVGSAVLLDGRLLRGINNLAGNLGGHMVLNLDGRKCSCGLPGCLETEGSTWALPSIAESLAGGRMLPKDLDFHMVFSEAAKGPGLMRDIRDHCVHAWAMGVLNMIHAYDPRRIIIGGGIMKSEDYILPYIRQKIEEMAWTPNNTVELVPAQQVEYAGVLGMKYLVTST